jgi:purine-nucleoside phosphorylase
VPEVIAARHMGLRVLAVSILTDACLPDALEPVDVPRIIATAEAAQPALTRLIRGVIARRSA